MKRDYPEFFKLVRTKFNRYDLDESGLIDSSEELEQLTTNVVVTVVGKNDPSFPPLPSKMVVTQAQTMKEVESWGFLVKGGR